MTSLSVMYMSMHTLLIPLFAAILGSCRADEPNNNAGVTGVELAFPSLSFYHPTDLQHAGDGSDRLFVLEQTGRIIVFQNSPSTSTTKVFLDIRARVNSAGSEEGLLGLAFHPHYASNGFLYVNYTASNPERTVIARYSADPGNPDQADPNSELVLMEYAQPYSNHNGGQVSFGPDGYLYIAAGDGGSGGDPHNNGQSLTTLLAKILRIDVDHPSGGLNYGIPSDNPFVGTGNREEIYAYGLRNPWRFSFDSTTGWLWAADVGQNAIEEIDIVHKGKNYGWRIMEGTSCYNPSTQCDTTGLVSPIWEYTHALGLSITGGFVYRGTLLPDLTGAYIYADYARGRIWSLRYDGIAPAMNAELARTTINVTTFGIDQNKELYICGYDGKIYRLK